MLRNLLVGNGEDRDEGMTTIQCDGDNLGKRKNKTKH